MPLRITSSLLSRCFACRDVGGPTMPLPRFVQSIESRRRRPRDAISLSKAESKIELLRGARLES